MADATAEQSLEDNVHEKSREDGEGIFKHVYEDGCEYTGEWNKSRCRDGVGCMKMTDGITYLGHFDNGLPSGLGVLRFSDGSRYEGEFTQGWFHGFGTFWRSDGMRYEGEFRGGKVLGKGLVTYADGTHGFPRQEGHFQDCRFVRKQRCPQVILKAQKVALIARSLP